MLTIIQAIAHMEGFLNDPDNIPTSHNNPGDIRSGQFANGHGAIPSAPDPRRESFDPQPSPIAVFPDAPTGWKALRSLLQTAYLGMTIQAAIERYAPVTENDTENYVRMICAWTGLTPDTVLTQENIG